MALEGFKARIALLLDEMTNQPEDAHEIQERLRETLAEMKAFGLPLPQDLVELERSLERDLGHGTRPRGPNDQPKKNG